MKKVAVLGSTGSIGTQTLEVIKKNSDKLKVCSLVAFSNSEKLAEQAQQFHPEYTALISRDGEQCLTEAVKNCDVAVVATKGIAALSSVLYCLENGIDVALANKEVLVCAGSLVMQKVGKGKLVPIDSEHSAIWQCLRANKGQKPQKILLTASGGPFFERSKADLGRVTPQQALLHPNWNMGAKITVDSATMFNKALEVVEAHWLFGVPTQDIEIVVHRQSVVHSMVVWPSGSVIAQLAVPDMKLPISLALLGEGPTDVAKLDFSQLQTYTFQPCDLEKFPCAKLGHEIQNYPPLAATVMTAANDVCVQRFLQGKLAFDKFYSVISGTVSHFAKSLENVPVTVENVKQWYEIATQYAISVTNS